jgi:hypothetical protein
VPSHSGGRPKCGWPHRAYHRPSTRVRQYGSGASLPDSAATAETWSRLRAMHCRQAAHQLSRRAGRPAPRAAGAQSSAVGEQDAPVPGGDAEPQAAYRPSPRPARCLRCWGPTRIEKVDHDRGAVWRAPGTVQPRSALDQHRPPDPRPWNTGSLPWKVGDTIHRPISAGHDEADAAEQGREAEREHRQPGQDVSRSLTYPRCGRSTVS